MNSTSAIQRELPGKMILELGYVGRIIRNEYQAIDLDSVPWMMTMGGQSFASRLRQSLLRDYRRTIDTASGLFRDGSWRSYLHFLQSGE